MTDNHHDPLEALFAADPAPEPINFDETAFTAEGNPVVAIRLSIEGVKTGNVILLPAGFPTTARNERTAVLLYASQIGSIVANAFIQHYFPEIEEN